MIETIEFTIGSEVVCNDGVCGDLIRVVVDPVARAVTHLVVEPKHRQGLARLVPLNLVDPTDENTRIRCTQKEFDNLVHAEETEFLPGSYGYDGYKTGQVLYQPYYGLGMGTMGTGMGMGMDDLGGNFSRPVIRDTIPLGEIAIRRGEHVHATDGDIGKVQGLVIDPRNHHVTHLLLQEGHLWGQKEVAIPIGAMVSFGEDGVMLNLAKDEVRDLPSVEFDHHQ